MGCIFHPELAVRSSPYPLLLPLLSLKEKCWGLAPLIQTCISWPSMQVTACHIIKHRDTQKPRGCFVEFETREDLEKALAKDGMVSPTQTSGFEQLSTHLQHKKAIDALCCETKTP